VSSTRPHSERGYRRAKRQTIGAGVLCAHCQTELATELDHWPPLAMHRHRTGTGCCRLIPSCRDCNAASGVEVQRGDWRPPGAEPEPLERDGLDATDERWRVPWLEPLLDVPPDAVWPRLMTVPHPRAVDSLGAELEAYSSKRGGVEFRWWQRLAAARLLEVDADGRLVWEAVILTLARQLGKSLLLRELALWRMHQGVRFGEPQDVLHTGKDLAICKEVQRPARVWAKGHRGEYKVREVNGQEEIELLRDGSRWMLRAKEAVYGYSVSLGAADEAWKVRTASIEEGLTPTMAERNQAQLLLISTAHRMATSLMLGRRQAALVELATGNGDLLLEWSAPRTSQIDDPAAWRRASPHWTPHRERLITARLTLARAGGDVEDPDEPDPIEAFRAQWLNQWPARQIQPSGDIEALLPDGCWEDLVEDGVSSSGPVWCAVEDDFGLAAAVAVAGVTADGRLELDGWLCADWDSAIESVEALATIRPIRTLLVGASMLERVPTSVSPRPTGAGTRELKTALPLFRDLAVNGALVHDATTGDIDEAVTRAQVRESLTGLILTARGPTHLTRALVWAVQAAHRPTKTPAIR
jgi:hypothetical protein